MPQTLQELRELICIGIAVDSINLPMLVGVWDDLQNRLENLSMSNRRIIVLKLEIVRIFLSIDVVVISICSVIR